MVVSVLTATIQNKIKNNLWDTTENQKNFNLRDQKAFLKVATQYTQHRVPIVQSHYQYFDYYTPQKLLVHLVISP